MARRSCGCACAAAAEPAAPRRIVPQPRQQRKYYCGCAAAPAIASKPPAGPVIARPPAAVAGTSEQACVVASARGCLHGCAGGGEACCGRACRRLRLRWLQRRVAAPVAGAGGSRLRRGGPAGATGCCGCGTGRGGGVAGLRLRLRSCCTAFARVIMPQTGPRPIYTAPAGAAATPQRGRPIFERPRPQAPGAPGAAVLRAWPGARRPMHPTRTFPGGPGGAPGGAPGRPGFAPGARPGFRPRPGFGARPGGAPGGAPGAAATGRVRSRG